MKMVGEMMPVGLLRKASERRPMMEPRPFGHGNADPGSADLHTFTCLKGHITERLPLPIPPENVSEPFHCDVCQKIYLRYHDGKVKRAPHNRRMF